MEWIDPRVQLPKNKECEVIIKGFSQWYGGGYYVSLWVPSLRGSGIFSGTGTDPDCGVYTFDLWSYID
jgi:hypothetical protein